MSQQESNFDYLQEYCPHCDGETPHSVTLEIRTEAGSSDNVGHSRTPYRVTECQQCGHTSSRRMNNV
ncbi:hypothetical protein K0C01_07835 [Salinarchaeum sp. IM2453]|uniref:DUF7835 family putative zinc beta-ribbon protein n=1 Tax=Salinarchaeum sp. IM2453 TaxID=2862870 RepID=UPI001C8407C1|nr:hypothetical protein [Salinarchaeum sp. IM2453]QZA87718.1 hypothetical protein K0C01_07835 [Salinarchaeum sp. IM2453]